MFSLQMARFDGSNLPTSKKDPAFTWTDVFEKKPDFFSTLGNFVILLICLYFSFVVVLLYVCVFLELVIYDFDTSDYAQLCLCKCFLQAWIAIKL